MPLPSNRLNTLDIFITNPCLMKRAMKIRFEKIRRKGERWWRMRYEKTSKERGSLSSSSASACADPAVTQNQASVLLVSRAKLMLGIENHEVDL